MIKLLVVVTNNCFLVLGDLSRNKSPNNSTPQQAFVTSDGQHLIDPGTCEEVVIGDTVQEFVMSILILQFKL